MMMTPKHIKLHFQNHRVYIYAEMKILDFSDYKIVDYFLKIESPPSLFFGDCGGPCIAYAP